MADDQLLQTALAQVAQVALKLDANEPIAPGTHIKITYDAKGLVTAGADAAIDDLSDVEITDLADGEVLKFNAVSGKWENVTGGGGSTVGSTLYLYNNFGGF